MAYIRPVPVEASTGRLRKLFDQAVARAGRVWNITHVMSVNPPTMEASIRFYRAVMFGPSALTRFQRELLAIVTSKAARCFY